MSLMIQVKPKIYREQNATSTNANLFINKNNHNKIIWGNKNEISASFHVSVL